PDIDDIETPGAIQDFAADGILAACQRLASDGAEAIVLGGSPLAGLAHRLRSEVSTPIFDGVEASISMMRLRLASQD
ncbi:MAG: aspartate/glutamate racemase family protein, partial [Pseudomonadota bacterium]